MSSTARKLMNGSIIRMSEFFITALVSLIMMPFVIHSLGDRMYGLWIFVGSFLGYYGLMDFGLSSAVNRYISRAIGIKDNEEANKVINTSLAIFLVIGFIALISSFVIAFFIPFFIKNITEVGIFRRLVLLLGLNFAIGFPLRVFSGVLTSNIRYDINSSVEIIKIILRSGLIVYLLKNGFGIMALALVTFVTDIAGYLSKYFIVRHLYSFIVVSRRLFDRSKVKSLFSYSIYTFVAQIADQLRFNVDNLVIVVFIGLNPITLYSIASRLIRYFIDFIVSAAGVLMPVFSQYESVGDYQSIRDRFILATKITSYMSILIGGTLIIFGKAFIKSWMGREYSASYPILIVLLVPIIFALMQSPSIQLLQGISKHRFFAISNLSEGLANLILSVIFVKWFGLIGVALGTAIPMTVVKLFVQPVYTCHLIKIDIRKYYFDVMVPILGKSIAILSICWVIFKNLMTANYFNLLLLITCEIFLFTFSIFFIGLSDIEQGYFKELLFKVKPTAQ